MHVDTCYIVRSHRHFCFLAYCVLYSALEFTTTLAALADPIVAAAAGASGALVDVTLGAVAVAHPAAAAELALDAVAVALRGPRARALRISADSRSWSYREKLLVVAFADFAAGDNVGFADLDLTCFLSRDGDEEGGQGGDGEELRQRAPTGLISPSWFVKIK